MKNTSIAVAYAAALSGFACSAGAAWAQQSIEVDPIDVTAEDQRGGENVEPGDVFIGSEQLEFTGPSKLSDVFGGETAVSTGGVIGTATKTYVHGLEEENLNVTVDGVRQGGGGWHHTGNLLIDPELLKAVTVKPGVASADDGPGALAGSIAYETKDARDLLEPGSDLGGYGKLEWRSNGNSLKETGVVYGRQSGMEFLLSGSLFDGDPYEDGAGDEVRYSAPDMYSMLGKFAINAPDGHRFETSFENTADDGDRDLRQNFGTPVGAPPFAPNVVVPSKTTRSTYTLSYADETRDGLVTPSAQFSYNRTIFDTDQPETPPAGGAIDIHSETQSYSAKLNGDVETGSGVVSLGVDFAHDQSTGYAGSTVSAGPPTFNVNTPGYTEERRNLGAYAQARLQATDMVHLSFGGRADQQWFYGASGEEFSDAGFSGNATLEVKPIDWLSLSAGYANVWGGYSFAEAGLLGFAPVGGTGAVPDYTGFKVSTSESFRIGGEASSDGFTAAAYVFRTTIEDANDKSGTARGDSSDLETEGVDAKLGYRQENAFITAKYTFTDVSEDGVEPGTTNYYQTSPGGHLFALQAGFQPMDGFTIGGSAEIALEYDEVEEIGLQALPAYEVVNLFVEYEMQSLPGFSIRAEVENLFDELYADRSSEGSGNPAVALPRNQPGRSFGVIAKASF